MTGGAPIHVISLEPCMTSDGNFLKPAFGLAGNVEPLRHAIVHLQWSMDANNSAFDFLCFMCK